MNAVLLYGLIYPAAAASLLAVLALMIRGSAPVPLLWTVTAIGVVVSAIRLVYLERSGSWGIDYQIFRQVGQDVWSGLDPYEPSRFWNHRFLHPPSAFPLFTLFAAPSPRIGLWVWSLINSTLAFAMVWIARASLSAQGDRASLALSHAELGALATAFSLSDACMATIQLGQIPLLMSAFLLLALYAQGQRRPLLSGAALGLATAKISTTMPFLLLFHRRIDLKVWFSLAVTVLLLICLGGQPKRTLEQCRAELHYISKMSQTGQTNDISYAGPQNESILGIDHAFYRLGVRNRSALAFIQLAALGLIGGWLAWEVIGARIPRTLAISMVSLFSVIFLYHRLYDSVMFAPPLVYATGQAKVCSGRTRVLASAAAISMLLVLYMRRRTLAAITHWAPAHGLPGRIAEIVILPYGTWLILLSMVCLRLAQRTNYEIEAW